MSNVNGIVVAIHIGPESGGPLAPVESVRAVAGEGLEGDRYFTGRGTFSAEERETDEHVTLIEAESIENFNAEYGASLTPIDTRRNIVTRGIPLNDLVGREFSIGDVRLYGHRLCEPCAHLAKLTDG